MKKRVNAFINKESEDLPNDKKLIIKSILGNLQIKNDVRIKNILSKFKKKQDNIKTNKAMQMVNDFKVINEKIVEYGNDEIDKLENSNIQKKFNNLKESLANTSIALIEKNLDDELEKDDKIKKDDELKSNDIIELEQLQFDFETLNQKIKTINNILDFTYEENIDIDNLNINKSISSKYNIKNKKDYFYLYKKYKIKYINLKKIYKLKK